jgi:hypothetical protein
MHGVSNKHASSQGRVGNKIKTLFFWLGDNDDKDYTGNSISRPRRSTSRLRSEFGHFRSPESHFRRSSVTGASGHWPRPGVSVVKLFFSSSQTLQLIWPLRQWRRKLASKHWLLASMLLNLVSFPLTLKQNKLECLSQGNLFSNGVIVAGKARSLP